MVSFVLREDAAAPSGGLEPPQVLGLGAVSASLMVCEGNHLVPFS